MTQSLRAERNYGIDLLRIISMYMIVVLHLIGIGNIFEYASLCSVESFGISSGKLLCFNIWLCCT